MACELGGSFSTCVLSCKIRVYRVLLHRVGARMMMDLKTPGFLKIMHLSVVMAITCHPYVPSLKRMVLFLVPLFSQL